jgi:hypothetical protein
MVQAIVETMCFTDSVAYRSLISKELISAHADYRLPEGSRQWLEGEWSSIARKLPLSLGWPFSQLAVMWLSESSSPFLRERALKDEHFYVRIAALSALARGWSQEEATRELLRERALKDENEYVRRAALEALARGRVDGRALALLSQDIDGSFPFLDPLEPISTDHLRKGAQRLQIAEATARELLASCEGLLGWNPLEGGRSKLEDAPTARVPPESSGAA